MLKSSPNLRKNCEHLMKKKMFEKKSHFKDLNALNMQKDFLIYITF
jgi:hypothetical protein